MRSSPDLVTRQVTSGKRWIHMDRTRGSCGLTGRSLPQDRGPPRPIKAPCAAVDQADAPLEPGAIAWPNHRRVAVRHDHARRGIAGCDAGHGSADPPREASARRRVWLMGLSTRSATRAHRPLFAPVSRAFCPARRGLGGCGMGECSLFHGAARHRRLSAMIRALSPDSISPPRGARHFARRVHGLVNATPRSAAMAAASAGSAATIRVTSPAPTLVAAGLRRDGRGVTSFWRNVSRSRFSLRARSSGLRDRNSCTCKVLPRVRAGAEDAPRRPPAASCKGPRPYGRNRVRIEA